MTKYNVNVLTKIYYSLSDDLGRTRCEEGTITRPGFQGGTNHQGEHSQFIHLNFSS